MWHVVSASVSQVPEVTLMRYASHPFADTFRSLRESGIAAETFSLSSNPHRLLSVTFVSNHENAGSGLFTKSQRGPAQARENSDESSSARQNIVQAEVSAKDIVLVSSSRKNPKMKEEAA